ncbi:MAG TPA: hypothetical protein VFP61_05520 [Acidimicrobiales bacterium]|nr:hypothetical protein [Acidimicrobiales bacterium]
MSPTGHCYAAGEYCPTADASQTGTNADGQPITCEMVSGRYHWVNG